MHDVQVAFEGLADSITGAAANSGEKFPFVTVPMFEVQGEHARRASGIEALTFAPLVTAEQRQEWEAYAVQHQGWIAQSRDVSLSGQELLQRSQYLEGPITPILYQHENPEPPYVEIPAVDGPFLPTWHVRSSCSCWFGSSLCLCAKTVTSLTFCLFVCLRCCRCRRHHHPSTRHLSITISCPSS